MESERKYMNIPVSDVCSDELEATAKSVQTTGWVGDRALNLCACALEGEIFNASSKCARRIYWK